MKRHAAGLQRKHLGHMKAASRQILHKQIMEKAEFLRRNFFSAVPGTKPVQVWGQRFMKAFGNDWYRMCLDMILRHGMRNACLSSYRMLGVHKGADEVCRGF